MVHFCFGPPVKLVKCHLHLSDSHPLCFCLYVNNCLVHIFCWKSASENEPQLHCLAITIQLTTDTVHSVKWWFVNELMNLFIFRNTGMKLLGHISILFNFFCLGQFLCCVNV